MQELQSLFTPATVRSSGRCLRFPTVAETGRASVHKWIPLPVLVRHSEDSSLIKWLRRVITAARLDPAVHLNVLDANRPVARWRQGEPQGRTRIVGHVSQDIRHVDSLRPGYPA